MTPEEQQEWQHRVPRTLAGPERGEPLSVWTAWMADSNGNPTGEWGVEAHIWGADAKATASLWVVCRDAEDAIGMQEHLRKFNTAEDLGRLQELAFIGHGQFVEPGPLVAPQFFTDGRSRMPDAAAASPQRQLNWDVLTQFETALHTLVPARASTIVGLHPLDENFDASKQLYRFVHDEVARTGVAPYALAKAVEKLPSWLTDVKNPPALAIWAIKQARASDNYASFVSRWYGTPAAPAAGAGQKPEQAGGPVVVGMRLGAVGSVGQAKMWAEHLDPHNAEHKLEAKLGYGHWGDAVNAVLARKFPSVVPHALAASRREREKQQQVVVVDGSVVANAPAPSPGQDPTTDVSAAVSSASRTELTAEKQAEMAAWVDSLDPAKNVNRSIARSSLGKSSVEIDRLLAKKFGMDDPGIAAAKAGEGDSLAVRLTELYPDGLPDPAAEAEAGSWRGRAEEAEQKAAAHHTTPDDVHTPVREDVVGEEQATTDHAVAAAHRGSGAAVAARPTMPRPVEPTRAPVAR